MEAAGAVGGGREGGGRGESTSKSGRHAIEVRENQIVEGNRILNALGGSLGETLRGGKGIRRTEEKKERIKGEREKERRRRS